MTDHDQSSGGITERFRQQYLESQQDVLRELPPMPKNMMVELSNACNHACLFCTSPNMTRKIARIDKGLLSRIMREAREGGVEEIGFYTTGEPFVHKDLEAFVREASRLDYRYIYISTNGAMATPERAAKVIDAGLNSIKFSINAGSRETYKLVHGYDDWDKVMHNLAFISQYRRSLGRPLKLFISFIITRHTAHEVEQFRAKVGHLVDDILFVPVHNQSGQMNEVQADLTTTETPAIHKGERVCPMPFNRLHVTCEGLLTICCVDYQNYLAVADLRKTSLAEAWGNTIFRDIRRRHLDGCIEGTLCGNCWKNRQDPVTPLVPEFATKVDFPEFYRQSKQAVDKRLNEAGADGAQD